MVLAGECSEVSAFCELQHEVTGFSPTADLGERDSPDHLVRAQKDAVACNAVLQCSASCACVSSVVRMTADVLLPSPCS